MTLKNYYYGENHDPDKNVQKFWAGFAYDNGEYFSIYGRLTDNGEAQTRTVSPPKTFSTAQEAEDKLTKTWADKQKKGYIPNPGPDWLQEDELQGIKDEAKLESYSLYVKSTSPVLPKHIESAFNDTQEVLREMQDEGVLTDLELEYQSVPYSDSDEDKAMVLIKQGGELQFSFGYISESEWQSQSESARNRALQDGKAPKGRINPEGGVQVSYETTAGSCDFPLRLFLHRLVKQCGLQVTDDFDADMEKYFGLPNMVEKFAWYKDYTVINEVLSRHGLAEGQSEADASLKKATGEVIGTMVW